MRVTTLFRQLIGVSELVVEEIHLAEEAVIASVRPRWRRPRCGRDIGILRVGLCLCNCCVIRGLKYANIA